MRLGVAAKVAQGGEVQVAGVAPGHKILKNEEEARLKKKKSKREKRINPGHKIGKNKNHTFGMVRSFA